MIDEEQEGDGPPEQDDSDHAPPASEKQLKFIRALQKKVEVSDDELDDLVMEVTDGPIDDLTVRNASEVIDELKIKAREKGIDLDAQPAVSEKQIKFIKSLKRRALLTDAEFASLLQEKGGVSSVADLGRRDASGVIDELKALEKKGGKKVVKKVVKDISDNDPEYEDPPF